MRFYKLLLIMPMLCVPMLANAGICPNNSNTISYNADNFSGIATCIVADGDEEDIETDFCGEGTLSGKGVGGKWNKGDCTSSSNDPYKTAATCKPMKAASDQAWKKHKTDSISYLRHKDGKIYEIPDPDGANIYRCVSTACREGYHVSKKGICEKDQPAPAAGDKGGENAEGGDNADGGSATIPAELKEAIAKLDTVMVGADKSVWKDKEGNFNTARLVSDSIAGVVLGTAGGLITSSVVKKNQLKKGFEDIKCTIGGQEVAGYGDEIKVGVK